MAASKSGDGDTAVAVAAPATDGKKAAAASSSSTASSSSSTDTNDVNSTNLVVKAIFVVLCLNALYRIGIEAYNIRLYAIREYGRVIHEFDPYFNYRAAEYLYANGWQRFSKWFDYMSWYPLGRPVGTTIYPGMQVTAVLIKDFILKDWSINDICCFIPAWFGVCATLAVFALTYICTMNHPLHTTTTGTDIASTQQYQSILNTIPVVDKFYRLLLLPVANMILRLVHTWLGTTFGLPVSLLRPRYAPHYNLVPLFSATAAAAIMAIVPAHLLRSVGGGYDNESVAMTAMVTTFACWCMSLACVVDSNCPTMQQKATVVVWGMITGIAYFNMVAAWGGYTFVINLMGVHAALLVAVGRYSLKLYLSYTVFYVIGTILAMQVPVVGWTPLKSIEQLGPLAVWIALQLLQACEVEISKRNAKVQNVKTGKLVKPMTFIQKMKLRAVVFAGAGVVLCAICAMLWPTGYFGPISSRVRGLFVKHTKTGNPLVDSVAEHQAANSQAYAQYLHNVLPLLPLCLAIEALCYYNDASSFLLVYSAAAYYFSLRMVRLILLTAPIASVLGGIVIGRSLAWACSALYIADVNSGHASSKPKASATTIDDNKSTATNGANMKSPPNGKKSKSAATSAAAAAASQAAAAAAIEDSVEDEKARNYSEPLWSRGLRLALAAYVVSQVALPKAKEFHKMAHEVAAQLSHPTIIQKATTRDGQIVMLDDYREAYFWLRDNTPKDARIMAWWDYGYQITGIGNRTTLADGNTWNHEHIALLGRILTAPEREAHRIARHLADYVLVWSGGGGDDIAKSPHLRRIANSVYRGLCSEPTCGDFGFYQDRTPTPAMAESLLYKLVGGGIKPGVEADKNRFREVYRSKYAKVRIYKIQSVSMESKEWVEKNRVCDAPGSWYCPGQYPPALRTILNEKKDFKQLEDFNSRSGGDEEYQREYFDNLLNKKNKKKPQDPPQAKPGISSDQQQASITAQPPPMDEEGDNPLTQYLTKKQLDASDIDMLNEHWENSPLTTMLWELISENRLAEFNSIVQESPGLAHVRSEDGRGPMWWAHEYGRRDFVAKMRELKVREDLRDAKDLTPLDVSKLN
jgi:dolichyl-diphosphooligosaccharide---protein glycosyltransferase